MSDLRTAAQQALEFIKATNASSSFWLVPESNLNKTVKALRAALEHPRTLTDEVIADLWHQNGGFHHHFARAVERWLKGKNHA